MVQQKKKKIHGYGAYPGTESEAFSSVLQKKRCLVMGSGGQVVVGWFLAADALSGHPQPGSRMRQGAAGSGPSPRYLCLVVVCCFPTKFLSLLLHPPLLSPLSCCMGSCSFPQRESCQNTCPPPHLTLLVTSALIPLFSHFLTFTKMEICQLLSFAWLVVTCTSNFQLPFPARGYF